MKKVGMILLAFGLLAVSVAAFALVSLPFKPPNKESVLARVPPPPPLDGSAPAPQPPNSPQGQEQPTAPSTVESVMQGFLARHKSLPERFPKGVTDELHLCLYQIAYCVLQETEPLNTFLRLMKDPDPRVRRTAVEAIWDASMAWMRKGNLEAQTLHRFWTVLDDEDLAPILAASAECLAQATKEGTETNALMVLNTMGLRALPAVPHMIWTSDHQSSPNMRILAMELAHILQPDSAATHELLLRRMVDPDSRVRREAWRFWLVTWMDR